MGVGNGRGHAKNVKEELVSHKGTEVTKKSFLMGRSRAAPAKDAEGAKEGQDLVSHEGTEVTKQSFLGEDQMRGSGEGIELANEGARAGWLAPTGFVVPKPYERLCFGVVRGF